MIPLLTGRSVVARADSAMRLVQVQQFAIHRECAKRCSPPGSGDSQCRQKCRNPLARLGGYLVLRPLPESDTVHPERLLVVHLTGRENTSEPESSPALVNSSNQPRYRSSEYRAMLAMSRIGPHPE